MHREGSCADPPRASLMLWSATETENELERMVDRLELLPAQPAERLAYTGYVRGREVVDHHAGADSLDVDLGAKRRRLRAYGGRRNDHRRQREQLGRLNDDRVPCAALLTASQASHGAEPDDVTPVH